MSYGSPGGGYDRPPGKIIITTSSTTTTMIRIFTFYKVYHGFEQATYADIFCNQTETRTHNLLHYID